MLCSCEVGMSTGAYTLSGTFPAHGLRISWRPASSRGLLDPRVSVIRAPLRIPIDRVLGHAPRVGGTSVRELGLAGRRRFGCAGRRCFGGRLTGGATKREGSHGGTDESDRSGGDERCAKAGSWSRAEAN